MIQQFEKIIEINTNSQQNTVIFSWWSPRNHVSNNDLEQLEEVAYELIIARHTLVALAVS